MTGQRVFKRMQTTSPLCLAVRAAAKRIHVPLHGNSTQAGPRSPRALAHPFPTPERFFFFIRSENETTQPEPKHLLNISCGANADQTDLFFFSITQILFPGKKNDMQHRWLQSTTKFLDTASFFFFFACPRGEILPCLTRERNSSLAHRVCSQLSAGDC